MTQEQEHNFIFEALYTVNKAIELFAFQNKRYWDGRRSALEMLIYNMNLYDDYKDWKENREK